ncbi:MAG: Do family serine endopeptidase [Gammaproteobacteria bacterium]
MTLITTYLRPFATIALVCGAIFLNNVALATLPHTADGQPIPSLAPMLKKVMPAVVNVIAQGKPARLKNPLLDPNDDRHGTPPSLRRNPDNGSNDTASMGSGVIVSAKNGVVLTNAHLVNQAKFIYVTLNDGRRFQGKLVGIDGDSDIAVLRIDGKNLAEIPLADSNQLKVGDFVVAIGSPFGLNQTATSGIVSALQRTDIGIEGYENFIQTDASINPGNSGGALVNLQGELVGINTAILAPAGGNVGIGFAIPSNMAVAIAAQLVKFGKLNRGLVGIRIQDFSPELAHAFKEDGYKGALITGVTPNTPAAKEGLRSGDLIIAINGNPIVNAGQARNAIGALRANSKIAIEILRNNRKYTYHLKNVAPKEQAEENKVHNPFFFGATLRNFAAQVPAFDHVKGVQVVNIKENSPSWQSGLRPGDVIISVDNQPTTDLDELNAVTDPKSDSILLNVLRANGALYIVVKK